MVAEPGLTMTTYAAEPGSPPHTPWPFSHPGQSPPRPSTTAAQPTNSEAGVQASRTATSALVVAALPLSFGALRRGEGQYAYRVGDLGYWTPSHDLAIFYADDQTIPAPAS